MGSRVLPVAREAALRHAASRGALPPPSLVGRRRPAYRLRQPGGLTVAAAVEGEGDDAGTAAKLRAVSVLCAAGAAETAYLTLARVLHREVACASAGCSSVLTSRFSELLGLPLSLYGFLTYAAVAVLAHRAAAAESAVAESPPIAVLGGTAVLASASGVFAYVLATQFPGETCLWCLGSIGISAAAFGVALAATSKADPLQRSVPPALASTAVAAVLVAGLGLGGVDDSVATAAIEELPYEEPNVTTKSSPTALRLVRMLRDVDAKMYGAFWCSHCLDQVGHLLPSPTSSPTLPPNYLPARTTFPPSMISATA